MANINLNWWDKNIIPRTNEYKDFILRYIEDLSRSPEEFSQDEEEEIEESLTEREEKFIAIYDFLKGKKADFTVNTNPYLIKEFIHGSYSETFANLTPGFAVEVLKNHSLNNPFLFVDRRDDTSVAVTNLSEKYKLISDLWGKELTTKTDISKGLNYTQIDEQHAYFHNMHLLAEKNLQNLKTVTSAQIPTSIFSEYLFRNNSMLEANDQVQKYSKLQDQHGVELASELRNNLFQDLDLFSDRVVAEYNITKQDFLNQLDQYENNLGISGSYSDLRELLYQDIDLFEHYEFIPEDIREIYDNMMSKEESNGLEYSDCESFLLEFNKKGYTFDYGLDSQPLWLRPTDPVEQSRLKERISSENQDELQNGYYKIDLHSIKSKSVEDQLSAIPDFLDRREITDWQKLELIKGNQIHTAENLADDEINLSFSLNDKGEISAYYRPTGEEYFLTLNQISFVKKETNTQTIKDAPKNQQQSVENITNSFDSNKDYKNSVNPDSNSLLSFGRDSDFIDDLFEDIDNGVGDLWKKEQPNNDSELIGGKIRDIAAASINEPETLLKYDENTQNVINNYVASGNDILVPDLKITSAQKMDYSKNEEFGKPISNPLTESQIDSIPDVVDGHILSNSEKTDLALGFLDFPSNGESYQLIEGRIVKTSLDDNLSPVSSFITKDNVTFKHDIVDRYLDLGQRTSISNQNDFGLNPLTKEEEFELQKLHNHLHNNNKEILNSQTKETIMENSENRQNRELQIGNIASVNNSSGFFKGKIEQIEGNDVTLKNLKGESKKIDSKEIYQFFPGQKYDKHEIELLFKNKPGGIAFEDLQKNDLTKLMRGDLTTTVYHGTKTQENGDDKNYSFKLRPFYSSEEKKIKITPEWKNSNEIDWSNVEKFGKKISPEDVEKLQAGKSIVLDINVNIANKPDYSVKLHYDKDLNNIVFDGFVNAKRNDNSQDLKINQEVPKKEFKDRFAYEEWLTNDVNIFDNASKINLHQLNKTFLVLDQTELNEFLTDFSIENKKIDIVLNSPDIIKGDDHIENLKSEILSDINSSSEKVDLFKEKFKALEPTNTNNNTLKR